MNPRIPWLFLFVLINVVAALIMFSTGELIGDLSGMRLHSESALFWATLLVIGSFCVVLGPVFQCVSKIKIEKFTFRGGEAILGQRIGRSLIVLQLIFLAFNLMTGVNIAGSNTVRSENLFGLIWVFIPVDMLFMIYYGVYREDRYVYPNLVLWIVSNLLRGWAGIFLTVIFIEWCRKKRLGHLSSLRVGLWGLLVLVAYPLVSNLKWIVRASTAAGLSLESIVEGLSSSLEAADYWMLMEHGLNHIVGRVQSVSNVVDVIRLSDFLQARFDAGDFAPFWMEGLHGIAYEKTFHSKPSVFIGVAFTGYEDFGFDYELGDWNVSLGYVSWLFIVPYLIPTYFLYTLLLCFLSMYLLKKIGANDLSKDMLWYVWLVYLMAPWFASFVAFIYAMMVFLVLKMLCSVASSRV